MDPKALMSMIGPVMGMFGQNMTNNNNAKAQQAALQQAQQIMGGATGAAKNSLASYLGQNPNPASQWGQIQQPGQYGGGMTQMPAGPGMVGYQGGFQPGAPQQPVLPPGWGPPRQSSGGGGFSHPGGGGFGNPGGGGFSNPGGGRMMQGGPIPGGGMSNPGRSPVMSLPIMLGGGGRQMQGGPIQAPGAGLNPIFGGGGPGAALPGGGGHFPLPGPLKY